MSTMDAFCVVFFFSFVIGLVFLVLLRFLVGCVVWFSVFLVTFAFAFGGLVVYIRSFQSGSETLSEEMTGNGADYRGGQRYTRRGSLYTCQRWDTDTPHVVGYNLTDYPQLENNYCRNPDGFASTIWCYTTDKNKKWELCNPVGISLPDCSKGYAVEDPGIREVLKIVAYVVWGLGIIWIIAICFLQKRIRLAVAINKVAAQFVYNNPTILAVPVVQILIGFIWLLVWIVCASFLLPSTAFATYTEAAGNATTPGACTDKWPSGIVYKYEGNVSSANDTCTGVYGDVTNIEPLCWRCSPPRYAFDVKFAGAFFTLLWNNAFLVALGQLIVAGACAQWFFTVAERERDPPVAADRFPLPPGLSGLWCLHLGFGAIHQVSHKVLPEAGQAAASKNRVMVIVLRILECCLWILEKLDIEQLILRNMVRFGVVAILGTVIHFIGWTVITVSTATVGYFIFQAFHPDADLLLPMFTYVATGYMVAQLFMNVFGLGVDTSLQGSEEYVPSELKSLVDSNPGKKKWALFGGSKVAPA
eukprot:s2680_g4.t1